MVNAPSPDKRRQAPKTILLSLEIASTWRQSRAPQVMMFIGTLVRRRMFGNVCDSGQEEKDARRETSFALARTQPIIISLFHYGFNFSSSALT